jgi:hypothetical protein
MPFKKTAYCTLQTNMHCIIQVFCKIHQELLLPEWCSRRATDEAKMKRQLVFTPFVCPLGHVLVAAFAADVVTVKEPRLAVTILIAISMFGTTGRLNIIK